MADDDIHRVPPPLGRGRVGTQKRPTWQEVERAIEEVKRDSARKRAQLEAITAGIMKRRTRLNADQQMEQAIHAFELALAEVRVIERRAQGVVTHRAIANRDALDRAKNAYARAAVAVDAVRIEEVEREGRAATVRIGIQRALERLVDARVRLEDLIQVAKG